MAGRTAEGLDIGGAKCAELKAEIDAYADSKKLGGRARSTGRRRGHASHGADYLKTVSTTDRRCTLLGKILPTQVTGDAEGGPVRVEFSWLPPQSSGS